MGQLCCPDVRAEHGSVTTLLALVTLHTAQEANSGQQRDLGYMVQEKKPTQVWF